MEWAKKTYNEQYESWVPWLEDIYLRWFTKDNKASYTTKSKLDSANPASKQHMDPTPTLISAQATWIRPKLRTLSKLIPYKTALTTLGLPRLARVVSCNRLETWYQNMV